LQQIDVLNDFNWPYVVKIVMTIAISIANWTTIAITIANWTTIAITIVNWATIAILL
jgi:hypothetical protein